MKRVFTSAPRAVVKNHPGHDELALVRLGVSHFLDLTGIDGRSLGQVKHCVYAVYAADGRPLFLSQNTQPFRLCIERHLAEPATMFAGLRAFEPGDIAEMEVWPLDGAIGRAGIFDHAELLDRALFEAFGSVLRESPLHCILTPRERERVRRVLLPPSTRQSVIPRNARFHHGHSEEHLAGSARLFAALARDISLRRITQTHRASLLAISKRLDRLASAAG
ncbi:MAG: hypothetical protein IPP94_03695 [Ignavibacteria bacterium]|nr:hypothetical protein [Ignavibacteria bacterium]